MLPLLALGGTGVGVNLVTPLEAWKIAEELSESLADRWLLEWPRTLEESSELLRDVCWEHRGPRPRNHVPIWNSPEVARCRQA